MQIKTLKANDINKIKKSLVKSTKLFKQRIKIPLTLFLCQQVQHLIF